LEIMRLFEPLVYNAVRTNKSRLCGTRSDYGSREDPKQEIEYFLKLVPEKRRDHARLALLRLFPRFENIRYSKGSVDEWEAQRLVCTEKHFGTYFRMSIGDETLSIAEIDGFIEHSGDKEYVKLAFRNALSSIRKNGKSKVPLLLDEVNVHAARIGKANIQPLISAIFEIADDILRHEDRERGGYYSCDNHLRIHWLIRKLTSERCNLDERNGIFMAGCQDAQVGWLVDFTGSAISDYFPANDKAPEPPEKCLLKKEVLSELKAHAIKTIKSAALSGKLLSHPQLPHILFRWNEFAEGGDAEVKSWTSEQLKTDKAVSMFARAFTSESWSHSMGMFGLGDRVAMPKVRAAVDGLERILDVGEFRRRLEALENGNTLDEDHKQYIQVFLEVWRKRKAVDDR